MTAASVAALALVDAFVRSPVRSPREVAAASGAEIRKVSEHPTWIRYQGTSTTGPFRSVELRIDREGSGALLILAEPAERFTVKELDLGRYGPRVSMEIGPPNAATWSARHARDGVTIAFTFRVTTDELVSVAIERR